MNKEYPEGTRWVVAEGAGLDSGRIGTVVSPEEIPMRDVGCIGGLVPDIEGHYKPADWNREVPLVDDTGVFFTMFKGYLYREP